MKVEEPAFFLQAIERLRELDPSLKPLWGTMTPQHMVEHLVGSWRISNGNARVKAMLNDEETAQRRSFLFSDKAYERNIPNPVFQGGTPPLRKKDLSDAIDQLEREMKDFFSYHQSNPESVEMHPVFGPLDYSGWMTFQSKHMRHHLAQFNLLQQED